ncbi:flagellar protein FlaG [Paenibacillus hubeiensis]|uniref:flagellar protein FlaG n=1 Tax=Paenibacillus hubeiensis TaxID=3077330 RepID=UPI0031BB97C9
MDSTIMGGKHTVSSMGGTSGIVSQSKSVGDPQKYPSLEAAVVSASIAPSVAQLHEAQVKALQELEQAMEAVQGPPKTLQISVHDKTQTIMIKVMNKETGDVIREVPAEKILDVVAKMMELNGILIDKKI